MEKHSVEKVNIDNASAMLQALENSGISILVYYPQERKIVIPESLCAPFQCESVLTDMPYSFAEKYVLPEDRYDFIDMYEKIHRGEKSATARFRTVDQSISIRDTLTTVEWDKNGEPKMVFGVITDASDSYCNELLTEQMQRIIATEEKDSEVEEAINIVASSISGQYYALYHIWVESRTYICLNENREGVLSAIGEKGAYDQALDFYVKTYVVPEDRDAMQKYTNLTAVKEQLRDRHAISCTYRQIGIGWTRGSFIAGKYDAEGNVTNIIYAVSDINDEVEHKEKERQVLYEAEHDPLTAAYNRNKLEAIITSHELDNTKFGFAIIDIDNFKQLNDNYGHEFGDQVLAALAEQLNTIFRAEDKLFRLGGDEFAVIFNNCDESAWDTLCRKMRSVHSGLRDCLQEKYEHSVTISGGICFSKNGYSEELYRLADEALYHIKLNGRAGCAMIDFNHNIIKTWHDLDSTKSQERSTLEYNRKSLAALFHNVPGGVVMYEWDGEKLRTLHISDYYDKEYGYTLIGREGGDRGPDYRFVHPDDLEDYQKAIVKALTDTHELHYEFRRWNKKQERYVWVHLDATSIEQSDGKSLVFALYTDVTEGKEAALSADKRQASLEAALEVSDQICCEYDPQTHIIECLIEVNFLNLPKVVYNYPDSMKDFHFIHPHDMDLFLRTAHSVDGSTTETCTIRCLKKGEYRWFICTFSPYYDAEKARNIAILTMQDVTQRMETMHSYEERLRSLLAAREEAISMCTINVSQDTFEMVEVENGVKNLVVESESFETVVLGVADNIIGESSQRTYRQLFSRENLLRQAAEGNMHVQMEYLIQLEEKHYEWITAAVDLVKNPITEDTVGVGYSKISKTEKMKEALLCKTIQQDFLFAAMIFTDTDEFYLYDPVAARFGERMTDYWDVAVKDATPRCSPDTLKSLLSVVRKENVLSHLETEADYSFAYDSVLGGRICRLEIRFSFADEAHTMILASMRNITDISLLEQFRHDSEHDPLTDLYNRKKTFTKCREILDTHPEDQFVMVHADLQHFRLYNTFFGEAAGDKLLCDAADVLRWMTKDYDDCVYGRIEADVFCLFFPYEKELYQKHINKALEFLKDYRTDFLIEPKIGMYFVTEREMSIDSMFTRATLAAKTVQTGIPYATVIYDEALEQKLTTERQIVNDMHRAIDEEQFEVYLQPKYSLRTNKPIGAEALVRWNHPKKGIISPGAFIPVFESNGFITTLDRYMWDHVCQILHKWKKEGKTLAPVSVNVSRLSMYSKATVHYLKALVEKYDIEPKYLELELTESAYIDDPEEMKKQMFALRDAGFKILLDDFGSGYSSLNTLRELPVDVLKMDMKFLSLEQTDIRGGLVISSIIRMAKLLDLMVIAEGVETQEQADFLKGVGCGYVQGYLFARPMPVKEYENILVSSEHPLSHVNLIGIDHIGRILAETGSGTYEMGTVIPTPLVCMEYLDGRFNFMRVNPEFYAEFNLEEEFKPATQIFRKRLSAKSHAALVRAIEESRQTGKKTLAPILWNCEDGTQRRYCCRISYEGNVGATMVAVVVFIRITDDVLAIMDEQVNEANTKGEYQLYF